MTAPIDVLVVGGGPAGLATAIHLKQQLAAASGEASVAVIDKAPRPGYHCLSGAAFEPACLDDGTARSSFSRAAFIAAVGGKGKAAPSGEDGLIALALAEAALKSVAEGRKVKMSEIL